MTAGIDVGALVKSHHVNHSQSQIQSFLSLCRNCSMHGCRQPVTFDLQMDSGVMRSNGQMIVCLGVEYRAGFDIMNAFSQLDLPKAY